MWKWLFLLFFAFFIIVGLFLHHKLGPSFLFFGELYLKRSGNFFKIILNAWFLIDFIFLLSLKFELSQFFIDDIKLLPQFLFASNTVKDLLKTVHN